MSEHIRQDKIRGGKCIREKVMVVLVVKKMVKSWVVWSCDTETRRSPSKKKNIYQI